MAKIKAPLFSLDATGTLDKNITYKGLKQKHIAQKYSQPGAKNPFESSPRQKDQRSIIRLITIHWQCMSSADKLSWENAAKDVRFKGTGYHYFLHMAQQNLTQYLGLVGYWSMNYNIDDKIPDLSGNGNHGILSPIYPCDCPTLVDSFDKKHGKSLSFDGLTEYLNLDKDIFDGFSSGTILLFFKLDPTGWTYSYETILAKFNGPSFVNNHIQIGRNGSSNDIILIISDNITSTHADVNIGAITPGVWYSISMTWNGSRLEGYLNGIWRDGVDTSISIPSNSTSFFFCKGATSPRYFNGLLDEVLFFDYALSSSTINRYYSI